MKDNFSTGSDKYAQYRPTYPAGLYDFLVTLVNKRQRAWDCGTGNGQVAIELAKRFEKVYATDLSQSQVEHAAKAANIEYSVQPAEKTGFPDDFFDLIVVAQAIHWFDFDLFYKEARRTAANGAVLCIIGYGKVEIAPGIDSLVEDFYENVVGPYWDEERRYIDESYRTIPFPFNDLDFPGFGMEQNWTADHFLEYLRTWSAVKHFIKDRRYDPVDDLAGPLKELWPKEQLMQLKFPLFVRVARIVK